MARKRSLSAEINRDSAVRSAGSLARDLLVNLILNADDEGRLEYEPERWAGEFYWDCPEMDVGKLIWKLSRRGLIYKYRIGRGRAAVILVGWFNWQTSRSHSTLSQIPLPPARQMAAMLSRSCDNASTMLTQCPNNGSTMRSYLHALCLHYEYTMRSHDSPVVRRKSKERMVLLGSIVAGNSGISVAELWKQLGVGAETGSQDLKGRKKEVS